MPTRVNYPVVAPLNDLAIGVELVRVDDDETSATFGREVPLTDAGGVTVRAFVSVSKASDAAPLAPSLDVQAKHTRAGIWLAKFDRGDMDPALLETAFGSGAIPYVMIDTAAGVFVHVQCVYDPTPGAVLI
jgi:hypothetical protein